MPLPRAASPTTLWISPHFSPTTTPAAHFARALDAHGKAAGVSMPGCRGLRMLPAFRRVEEVGRPPAVLAGFAILGLAEGAPAASLPILASELPVGPYSRKDEVVLVRDWRGGGSGSGSGSHFFKATVMELTIGGHSEIMRVREAGSKDKSGVHDVHRSRVLLGDPRKRDVRGSRAHPPGQLEVVRVEKGGGEEGPWRVHWRRGGATLEEFSVLWHLRVPLPPPAQGQPEEGAPLLLERMFGIPAGTKE